MIKEHALEGNIIRTPDILNRIGFRIEDRAIELQCITQFIISTPAHDDALHKEIRRLYLKKTTAKEFLPNLTFIDRRKGLLLRNYKVN